MRFKSGRAIKISQWAWENDRSMLLGTIEQAIDDRIYCENKTQRVIIEDFVESRSDAQNRYM